MIPILKNKTTTENLVGMLALTVANAAGLIHMVVLPFWVGSLMMTFKLDPSAAGLMVTLYIVGMLASSAFTGGRFNSIKPPLWTVGGFLFGLLMFLSLMQDSSILVLDGLHFLAGAGVGVALSCTSGTLGRGSNPHALFAKATFGFAIITFIALAVTPLIVDRNGANGMFGVMATVMLVALIASALAFPPLPVRASAETHIAAHAPAIAVDKTSVWFAFIGIGLLTTSHALAWSFAQSLAGFRNFSPDSVKMAFGVTGILGIAIPIAAGILEKKWPASWVCAVGGVGYGLFAVLLSNSTDFMFYGIALGAMMSCILVAQIFAFGLIAHLDLSGKASATLPAILMGGAAVGPFLGGMVVHQFGYPALGFASLMLCAVGVVSFVMLARRQSSHVAHPAPAATLVGEPQAAIAPVHPGMPQADLPK